MRPFRQLGSDQGAKPLPSDDIEPAPLPGDPPTHAFALRPSLRRLISLGPVARNVVAVAGGTAIGQVIVIASSPIISRLYAPADLGLLSVYASCVSLTQSAVSLRYDLAIQVPKSSRDAARLFIAAVVVASATTTIIAIGLWFGRRFLTQLVGAPGFAPYMLLVPLGILGAALYQALTAWSVRQGRYGEIGRTRITQHLGLVLTQLGLGFLRIGPIGLILGDVVGRIGGSGSLGRAMRRMDSALFRELSSRRVIVTAKRFAGFSLLASAAGIVNSLGLFGPALLFASLFGPAVAGQIALSQRVIALPLTLAGQSVAQVYVGELARLTREMPRAIPGFIRSTVMRLALVASVPTLALVFAGPWLFSLVFGAPWRMAGDFARVLAFAFAIQMVAAPISQTLNLLGQSRLQLVWDVVRCVLVLGAIWLTWHAGLSPLRAVISYSAAMVLAYASMVGIASAVARRAAMGTAGGRQ